MKIAIFHHHLNRGGVTQVIVNQLRAIDSVTHSEPIEVLLFFGGRKAAWPEQIAQQLKHIRLDFVVMEQLDYDDVRAASQSDDHLAQLINQQLADRDFKPSNCILHFHNHNLGKNWELIEAVNKLASSGFRMILQIHDFAEDFRPDNFRYLKQKSAAVSADLIDCLYPSATNVLFGVINKRDLANLNQLGIDRERIEYLPNPVAQIDGLVETQIAKTKLARYCDVNPEVPLLVYPVRAIRRKNIGEAILLTLLAEQPIQIGITLPPINPLESAPYEAWKDLAQQLRMPVFFEIGQIEQLSFAEVLSAADQILTTSVTEGFGMVFLEALAIEKPLIGRNIPEITADFLEVGILFPNLFDELRVPIKSLSLPDYRRSLVEIVDQFQQDFERAFDTDVVDELVSKAIQQGWIDFARLPGEMQMEFVRSSVSDMEVRQEFQQLNPDYSKQLITPTNSKSIGVANQQLVRNDFSFERIGQRLIDIYQRMLNQTPGPLPKIDDANSLIDCFLKPEKMFPIRFEKTLGQPSRNYIDWSAIIINNSQRLDPIPTELESRLEQLADIQIVLFDIYGTLLVSSSGDIGTDRQFDGTTTEGNSNQLLQMLNQLGLNFDQAGIEIKNAILKKHESLRRLGIPHPEIDIVAIWKRLIENKTIHPNQGDLLADDGLPNPNPGWPTSRIRELALRYELASNPVFPMPDLIPCIGAIRKKGLKLGIISNAQFYTPLLMEAFCKQTIDELGFDKGLCFFSYCFGRAKPDLFLYQSAANAVSDLGYTPGQVLYVGNDMTKDIVPAKTVGFKTGLFAGDQRSLRLGKYHLPLTSTWVDLILQELTQIDERLSTSTEKEHDTVKHQPD